MKKKIGIILAAAIIISALGSCGNTSKETSSGADTTGVNTTVTTPEKEEVQQPAMETISQTAETSPVDSFIETTETHYHGLEEEENELVIDFSQDPYTFSLSIFRLALIDGTAVRDGDNLSFEGTDPNGEPIKGTIEKKDNGCELTFTDSTWELLENGTKFGFVKDGENAKTGVPEAAADNEASAEAITQDQALAAIKKYCFANNPELEEKADSDEYTVYFDVSTNENGEIVVLCRSYTGALTRYYIDPSSGEVYVTEQVPGIIDDEQRTDESFNIKTYID